MGVVSDKVKVGSYILHCCVAMEESGGERERGGEGVGDGETFTRTDVLLP